MTNDGGDLDAAHCKTPAVNTLQIGQNVWNVIVHRKKIYTKEFADLKPNFFHPKIIYIDLELQNKLFELAVDKERRMNFENLASLLRLENQLRIVILSLLTSHSFLQL